MTGTFLDVDAPNTAWRSGSEDPIPVLFGRYAATAAAWRYFTCRPMDGVSRTDATFWEPGTVSFTRSGRTGPWNYWPGWKRGLLLTRYPQLVGLHATVGAVADWMHLNTPWWMDPWFSMSLIAPVVGYGAFAGVRGVRTYKFNREVVWPVRNAVIATLGTRDGVTVDIPPGLVRGADVMALGRIGLPSTHPLAEGHKENMLNAVRERLGHGALDARWNMEGARPHAELFTPPQPPSLIDWDTMLDHADEVSPYLGHSAGHAVRWDLGDDSPHLAVAGGSGSGKSELLAWIVAQFMRGGAGIVVLDPKYSSHRWLMRVPQVLYCTEAQMLHDTILWLDAELRRRGLASQHSTEQQPRIVVVLEERNSMQTMLREHWNTIRPRGWRGASPALAALDRLASQGRSLNINVLLAAQEVAKVDIGSRNNYGALAVAGRLPTPSWRLAMGAGSKKPAISTRPGRFGYVVGSEATVFQAAYPDLKHHADRLTAWATQGEQLLDVRELMQQYATPAFPSSEAITTVESTQTQVTLGEFAAQIADDTADKAEVNRKLAWLRSRRDRDEAFPEHVGTAGAAKLYSLDDLADWHEDQGEDR